MEVQVGPATVTIHSDDHVVVCEPDARMSSNKDQGYFARDTRFVSGYRLKLGRAAPVLLNSSQVQHYSARFEFTNPRLDTAGGEIPPQSLHLRLDRTVGHGVHDDYDLTNYSRQPVSVELEVSIESDFADLFDVKAGRLVRRGSIQSAWDEAGATLRTDYRHDIFERWIEVRAENAGSGTEFANGGISWRIEVPPGGTWHSCLRWVVALGAEDRPAEPDRRCHALLGRDTDHEQARQAWLDSTTSLTTSDSLVTAVLSQAVEDLSSLRMHVHDPAAIAAGGADDLDAWVPAAGIPWFVSLFGRDSLVVALQTLCLAPRFALGALRALGGLQADSYDDERDMQPGKIEHEVRHGELATLHLVPHTPYYGTHEATTLYVWTAAQSWWWHGDREELDAIRPHVERALEWIDGDGDPDGDGLQEYQTRALKDGYYNQGWKDSGDAIVDERGERAELPIALCEHQGYVVAAKRAWAGVLEAVYGDDARAGRLRAEADRLCGLIEERFWWEEEGTYFLGLDGAKRPLRTVASNPAHLLWARAVDPGRARRTARRLLAPDMWSGWGIRTLSANHPSYNPFSYQLGSVWPHDNVIAAAGFRHYGLDGEAATVIRAVFEAAARFQAGRPPELFAGLDREPGGFPVQYLGANVPQAWASGALVHAVHTLAGLQADAPHSALRLDPALPDWLGRLSLTNLRVGSGVASFTISRRDGTHHLHLDGASGLDVTLQGGT